MIYFVESPYKRENGRSGTKRGAISQALEADWHSEVVSAPEHSHTEAPLAPSEHPTKAIHRPETVAA